jgi:CRP/FNR family transcriptional regulator, cyclic AMP receptor protein
MSPTPQVKNPTALLAVVPLFASMSERQLKVLNQAMKVVKFGPGQNLISEGEDDARFYLIVEGTAKVTVKGRKKRQIGPGDYIGEMAVVDGGVRSATVTAETDVVTLSAARWNFEAVLKSNPTVALAILREMVRRVRELEGTATS